MNQAEAARSFLTEHSARIEPLRQGHADAWFSAQSSGDTTAFQRAAELQTQIRTIYSSRSDHERIAAWHQTDLGDPLLQQQVRLLHLEYTGNQLSPASIEEIVGRETEIEERYNAFRPTLHGRAMTQNEILELLKTSTDSLVCREAWEASKQIGAEVAGPLLELVRLRNRAARDLGFEDFYTMQLFLQELVPDHLVSILTDLDDTTTRAFQRTKARLDAWLAGRFGIAEDELRSWHYGDPFFQAPPTTDALDVDAPFRAADLEALAVRTFDGLGLDVRPVLAKSDLYERERKSQGALWLAANAPHDVRVLCNLKPTARWMEILLQVLGHAAYARYVDPSLPYPLRKAAHVLSTEAVAKLMGWLVYDPVWLAHVAGVPRDRLASMELAVRARLRESTVVLARWTLVMVWFERHLYADPGQDLNRLWWDYVQRFQHVRPPDRRNEPDWAAKLHLAISPVYYHNYQLGDLYAAQLLAAIRQRIGAASIVDQPAAGRFLVEQLFHEGARRDWNETLQRATGRPLGIGPFLQDFVLE